MIAKVCQRWLDHRSFYRPAREAFDPKGHEVHEMTSDAEARAFVEAHHYAASYPAARFRFGLRAGSSLVGVAVFSVPMRAEVLRPFAMNDGVGLGRLVLLDGVLANAESWFVARCFEALRRQGVAGVVSFSDPVRRTALDGRVVLPGHVGTVYQALNATYTGRSTARTLRLMPDGTIFSPRAASKIRNGEVGWRYAVEQLVAAGAPEPSSDLRTWLPVALAAVSRPLRHDGNHRYVWALNKRDRKHLPASLPYPKFVTDQHELPFAA